MDLSLKSKDDEKARIAVFIFSILLIILILYPFWSYTFPPPEKEGILVSFGDVEVIAGDQKEMGQETLDETEEETNEQMETATPSEATASKEEMTQQESPSKAEFISKEESQISANETIAKKSPSPEEIRKQKAAEKAEEEAKKQAAYEDAKKKFGNLLGGGNSQGEVKGNTGDQEGDPNAEALDRISKGKGKIAGGLADRGLIYEPEIDENSQKAGVVVVRVCVDTRGQVTEASYTQRGSTTTDTDLVRVAVDGAKKYRFSKSTIEKQCGTITIEFKLK